MITCSTESCVAIAKFQTLLEVLFMSLLIDPLHTQNIHLFFAIYNNADIQSVANFTFYFPRKGMENPIDLSFLQARFFTVGYCEHHRENVVFAVTEC
mgnify:CR=1 FL=1